MRRVVALEKLTTDEDLLLQILRDHSPKPMSLGELEIEVELRMVEQALDQLVEMGRVVEDGGGYRLGDGSGSVQ
jgi:hypothetical protein